MNFESSKTLGGIGAVLMLIGIFPYLSYYGIVELVGAALILVALHGLAGAYSDSGIFSNALYGVIIAVVGAIIVAILVFAVVLSNIKDLVTQIYPGWNGDWNTLQGMTPNTTNIDPAAIFPIISGLLVVLVIAWVIAIVATFFIWRSLKQVATKSKVGLFGTAGLLLFIGAIIPLFGLFLMWIAALLLAIAFFQLKPAEQQPPPQAAYTPPPTTV
jgi:uncharacterized membrane protein